MNPPILIVLINEPPPIAIAGVQRAVADDDSEHTWDLYASFSVCPRKINWHAGHMCVRHRYQNESKRLSPSGYFPKHLRRYSPPIRMFFYAYTCRQNNSFDFGATRPASQPRRTRLASALSGRPHSSHSGRANLMRYEPLIDRRIN